MRTHIGKSEDYLDEAEVERLYQLAQTEPGWGDQVERDELVEIIGKFYRHIEDQRNIINQMHSIKGNDSD